MARRVKTHEGDVFVIELKDGLYAYGQIVAKGSTSDCIVAFNFVTQTVITNIGEIVSKPVVFLFQTVDVDLTQGRWKIIGNASPPIGIKLPEYKIEATSGYKVLSYRGEIVRDASKNEIEKLNFLRSYAPRMLEKALKAKQGLIPWEPWMDEIVYKR